MQQGALEDYSKQREAFRLPMVASAPVYVLFSLDGEHIDPLADELGAGGARFVAANHYSRFYNGQMLGPAVLVLPEIGMPVVYPVVRWLSYPRVGVQFVDIDEKHREMIFRFMFKVERKLVQIEKTSTVQDRLIDAGFAENRG